MWRAQVDPASALYVANNMRVADRREIYATRWNEDPREVAADVIACGAFGWAVGLDRPIAVVGALPLHPGVWSVYMFATDEFDRIRFSLTKFVRRVMIPALRDAGAHRAECYSMVGHDVAQRWLTKSLGAEPGELKRGFGKNGEDFRCFAWRR